MLTCTYSVQVEGCETTSFLQIFKLIVIVLEKMEQKKDNKKAV